MNMKKILSVLMAVAMVLSMVVVPAYAEEINGPTLQLADANGNTTITAEAGSTVDVYMSAVGTWPESGYNNIGGYVTRPDGWTVKTTNILRKTLVLEDIDGEATFTNDDSINPVSVCWTTNGINVDSTAGTTRPMDVYGQLAMLTFTIPADAQAGTYDITLDTKKFNPNYVFKHDANGIITSYLEYTTLDVAAINCKIVIEGAPAECPDHGEQRWSDFTATGGALTTGHYKLSEAVSLTSALTVAADQTVCIDLAGNNLTQTTTLTRVFDIAAGGSLTIIDSVGTGVISGGQTTKGTASLGGNVLNAGTFTLYGGTLSGGQSQTNAAQASYARGGNIYGQAGSVINIAGGTVTGGKAFKTGSYTGTNGWIAGGNIYTEGELNISGGTISDGDVSHSYNNAYNNRPLRLYGGNIYLAAGAAMNVTGGTISGGQLTGTRTENSIGTASPDSTKGSDSWGYGGSIFATDATVNISGGTITGGKIDMDMIVAASGTNTYEGSNAKGLEILGGNLYVKGGSLTITGGTIENGSLLGDVTTGSEATSTGSTTLTAQGANIYVNGAALSVTGGKIAGGSIVANNTNSVEGGKAESLASGAGIYMTGCGSATIAGDAEVTGGTVTSNITATTKTADNDSKGGNIFVNNTTLTVGGNAVISDGTLTVNQSASRGANIYIANTATVELKDNATVTGGVSGPDKGDSRGGNIFVVGTLNMYGGTISDGYAGWGTNVMLQSGADMNMYGGKITGGTGASASILNQRGTVKVFDGEIHDTAVGEPALATDGTTATNGGNSYIFGGKVDSAKVNRQSYLHMLGGYLKGLSLASGINGAAYIYNGVTGFDPTDYVAACSNVAVGGTSVVWHAMGTCETCAHTFGAECAATTCGIVHEANTCVHTFVDGVCSICEYAAPAHTAACEKCGEVTWTIFNGTVEEGGHYYLADDAVLHETLAIAALNVCIDLNGYTLSAPIAERALSLTSAATLNLMDSSAAGTGTIKGLGYSVDDHGGLVSVNKSTLNVYDATLTGGVSSAERGGNVYVLDGQLTLDNAKVTDGKIIRDTAATRGGNVCNYGGIVIIKGADTKILNGYMTSSSGNVYGGNYYAGTGGCLYMYDGEITGGYAKGGANLAIMNGTLEKGWNSVNAIYGGFIGDVNENTSATAGSLRVYGGSDYDNELYIFGGEIEGLVTTSGKPTLVVYGGVLDVNPTTANYGKSSVLADCSCFTYDEETGLYTVGHLNGTATCGACAGNDAGYVGGYSEAYTYTNLATHTYAEDATVCSNCANVVAKIGDTEYTELTTALDAAEAADTVVLVKDAFVNGDVDVYSKLDLNGKALSASGIVSAENNDAVITDSVGTGSASGSEVKMHAGNGMLAIDEKNDGVYTYETVTVAQKVLIDEDYSDTADMKFYIENAADATKLDEAITAGDDVKIRITVTSDAITGGSHSYVYNDELVSQYVADWDKKMFTCTIIGLDALGDFTITAEVVSNGVVVAAYDFEG